MVGTFFNVEQIRKGISSLCLRVLKSVYGRTHWICFKGIFSEMAEV